MFNIQKINKNNRKKFFNSALLELKDFVLIVVGAFLISLAINMFLLPHKITNGGASGIATIFYYLANVPMGITILLINLPLFIVSICKFGFKFSIKTIVSTVLLSVFLEVFTYDNFIGQNMTDLFTSCIFGGLVAGIGLSLTFKASASSGGSDLLAQIIYKSTSLQSLSQILLIIEAVIILGIMISFKDINIGLYSLISIFISTKVIDILFEGVNYTKVANIITNHPDCIIAAIINDLNRSATITNTIGAHSGENNTTITCIITRPQIAKLKSIVKENDKKAIIYIFAVNEVLGHGFKTI